MAKSAAFAVAIFVAGFLAGVSMTSTPALHAQGNRVFEIRTYTAAPGKLDTLKARFRDHTVRIFDRHDMKSIGYWTPQDAPLSQNTLIYVLAHPSREAAKKNWDAFRTDPEWVKVREASEAAGKVVDHVESVFADPADFSPIK